MKIFRIFDFGLVATLALAGIAIALIGALLPAQWAARSRIAEVLQAE